MIKQNTRNKNFSNIHFDTLVYHIANSILADGKYNYKMRVIRSWFDEKDDANKQFRKLCTPLVKIKKRILKYAKKEEIMLNKHMKYLDDRNYKKMNKIIKNRNKQIVFKWKKEIIFISNTTNSIYTYALHKYAMNNFDYLMSEIISKWNETSDLKWEWKYEVIKKRYLDFFIKY